MSTHVTLAQFIAEEHSRIWQDSTDKHQSETEVKLDRFTAFAGYGSRTLDTFKPKDIHRFQDHLLAVGLSKSTVNRYSSAISKVFKHAVDNDNGAQAVDVFYVKDMIGLKITSENKQNAIKDKLQEAIELGAESSMA